MEGCLACLHDFTAQHQRKIKKKQGLFALENNYTAAMSSLIHNLQQ